MNIQIQDKLRRLYREIEKSIPDSVKYIADENLPISPDTLRKVMFERDGEARAEVGSLIDAILEDIADPNRSDSFTDFEETAKELVMDIIEEQPGIYYETGWEKKVASRLAEKNGFYDLTVEQASEKATELICSKRMRDAIEDRLHDMAELKQARKDPHGYRGVSENNIVGV